MTQPRNERKLPDLTVGDPADGGRLTVGVRAKGRVWINASRGTGVTVDLGADDEEAVRRWLNEVGRREQPDPDGVTRTGSPEQPNPQGAATP